jgi:hypothetical protein
MAIESSFPAVIDSSMLAAYRACPQSFRLAYTDHWKLKGESVHLHAGGAFAKAMEAGRRAYYVHEMIQQDSEAEAMRALILAYGDFEAPEGSAKTLDRMMGALEFYYETYPLDTDPARVVLLGNTHAVEFSFSTPISILHPVTQEPIIFAGKADAVVEYGGGLYVMDEKTTTQLGSTWARQWDLRGQFSGYAWALHQLGERPAGSIVRGISILKTKYDTQEAVVGQPDWKVDRWELMMYRTINDMIDDWTAGQWDYDLSESCNHYGGCAYKQCCMAPDPTPWLNLNYEKRVWDPLSHRETKE